MAAPLQRIGIVGAGAWGTALAIAARRAGRDVTLWARRTEQAEAIRGERENREHLPGVAISPDITVTAENSDLAACDALLLLGPAQHLRAVMAPLALHIPEGRPLVLCAKGIETESGKLLSEVLGEVLPGRPLAVLSGPSFAAEVAAGKPTAVTLACGERELGAALAQALGERHFRPYLSDDPLGAELGGALKNVVALACGAVAGLDLGENARAALVTRGLAEMARLGAALGARRETFMGLSGLGDLTLTCGSGSSRNFRLGEALGRGLDLEAALAESAGVTEGVYTAAAAVRLAREQGVRMPICAAVDAVVNAGAALRETVGGLLDRPLASEGE